MKYARLMCEGRVLIPAVMVTTTRREGMKGLLGRSGLERGTALFIPGCSCIHTFFMKFDLDLVFVDADLAVRKVVRNVPPRTIAYGGRKTRGVFELQSGWMPDLGPGRRCRLDPVSGTDQPEVAAA